MLFSFFFSLLIIYPRIYQYIFELKLVKHVSASRICSLQEQISLGDRQFVYIYDFSFLISGRTTLEASIPHAPGIYFYIPRDRYSLFFFIFGLPFCFFRSARTALKASPIPHAPKSVVHHTYDHSRYPPASRRRTLRPGPRHTLQAPSLPLPCQKQRGPQARARRRRRRRRVLLVCSCCWLAPHPAPTYHCVSGGDYPTALIAQTRPRGNPGYRDARAVVSPGPAAPVDRKRQPAGSSSPSSASRRCGRNRLVVTVPLTVPRCC